ncbi:MAG: SUMF1/EgtB/PvdO family nonheme iron enzyme [Aggregatilineales bacterium]
MSLHDDLIEKLNARIYRCKIGKEDAHTEFELGRIPLNVLNNRLTDYDQQIAEAQAELRELQPPEPVPSVAVVTTTPGESWDIFISYPRQAEAEAKEVYRQLTAAGFSVWQDVQNIRHTARWPMVIDGALRHSGRLVLLVTPEAMASDEVFNEWFFFYKNRKPLHCLYVNTCEIHFQLLPFQYLDWRDPAHREWARLMAELRAAFTFPATAVLTPIIAAPESPKPDPPIRRSDFADLLETVHDPAGSIAFSLDQIKQLAEYSPADRAEYHLTRIAAWSQPRYVLDKRFVRLTLLIDQGEKAEGMRWQSQEQGRFADLREVLSARADDRALVLLGAPGSGKSTLLRRLQLDSAIDSLRRNDDRLTFFIPLNGYRSENGLPREWLNREWTRQYSHLPTLDTLLREGRTLLLLDALNEMPNSGPTDYHDRVDLWRQFLATLEPGNRVVFSCRSLDYSASLSRDELPVPQIVVQPMADEQIRDFLNAYLPSRAEGVWKELAGTPQLNVFRTPFFLKLLCDQVETTARIPKGRAELFAGYVRGALKREVQNGNRLLRPDTLLTERDHRKLTGNSWHSSLDLPDDGSLLPKMADLAFTMQQHGLRSDGAQIRLDYKAACDLIRHERSRDMIRAGVSLNVLDEDLSRDEILFFHQLLQEFFAARKLAENPNPELARVEWQVGKVTPTLAETIAGLADSDPLPLLPQTGWEETTLLAAVMAKDPDAFIRALLPVNLSLAARAVASAEIKVSTALKREIQNALIARTQDMTADLRARIAAGLALGELGDPRFERRTGAYGDYLLPPLSKQIPAGDYPIGDDHSDYADEKPARIITLDSFQIGVFPVTNAEYALFVAASGYDDESWWETAAAKAWRKGEGSTEGQKQAAREYRDYLKKNLKRHQSRADVTVEEAGQAQELVEMSDADFEALLDEVYQSGKRYTTPEYWNDSAYNNPAQPVVGICWHEARAYCAWLSAQTEQHFRLPTEVEFEAAARGTEGRQYPYGTDFDSARCNTFESHIRRTTPVGIFDNVTSEGAFDLLGNVYTWTSSIYDPYPYVASDGREDVNRTDVRFVLRGGSWYFSRDFARSASRYSYHPGGRFYNFGFGLGLVGVRPPSL